MYSLETAELLDLLDRSKHVIEFARLLPLPAGWSNQDAAKIVGHRRSLSNKAEELGDVVCDLTRHGVLESPLGSHRLTKEFQGVLDDVLKERSFTDASRDDVEEVALRFTQNRRSRHRGQFRSGRPRG